MAYLAKPDARFHETNHLRLAMEGRRLAALLVRGAVLAEVTLALPG